MRGRQDHPSCGRNREEGLPVGAGRVHRPWVTEPGMWVQYDFGDGPVIDSSCSLSGTRTPMVVPFQ